VNMEIRNSKEAVGIEKKIRTDFLNNKLKLVHVKKFLESYYDGDPDCGDCGKKCKEPLDCYIDIHKALIADDGERKEFKTLYVRDKQYHCCGRQTAKLPNGKQFCTVCGNEY
jgi:hypothetical protein